MDDNEAKPQYKPGDIVDGRYKVLRNGAGYDLQTKRIAHPPFTYIPEQLTTSIKPSELSTRRWENFRAAAENGMIEGVSEINPVETPVAAWGVIVEKQTELATSPDQGHASVQAARFVGSAVDALPDRRAGTQVAAQVNIQVNVTGDMGADDWTDDSVGVVEVE